MPREWDDLVKQTADIVARIAAERSTIQLELAEIRELLGGGKSAESAPARSDATPRAKSDGRTDTRPPQPTDAPELPPDELAFLRSLITPEVAAKAVAASPPAEAPTPGAAAVKEAEPLLDPKRGGRETPALSMNVPGSEEIVIRSDKDGKTLKCAECGALNVPTEWYCESCGSELATD